MRILHLRTADRGADEAIASWLQSHDTEVIECADPFDACLAALAADEPAPELALVGLDWVSPDDFTVVGYFRESWPGIVVVFYGSPRVAASFPAAPLTIVCRTAESFEELLRGSPAALRSRCSDAHRPTRRILDDWRATPPAPAPNASPPSELADFPPPASSNNAGDSPPRNVEYPPPPTVIAVDEVTAPPDRIPPADKRTSATVRQEHAPPPRVDALTPEELAMLLEDWAPKLNRGD